MILGLLFAHLCGIAFAMAVGNKSMRVALTAASIAPAATAIWALSLLGAGTPETAELMWVRGLDISLSFRLDAVALLMTLLVSGIGAGVFIYATGYFNPHTKGARFPASLLAFSFSMLGLVWADSIWTLFIFWEFTSITSFLLVGYKHVDPAVRTAARRALMITGGGGLALLAGLMILGSESGTTSLTNMSPVSGTTASVAAVLILFGAATKSAQVPFHVWLPGAMAAPTPVSAYLHSATMVKAGVLLIAVASPIVGDLAIWKILGTTFGIVSMLWGGVGALRHRDAKLILAWGTVSQLGFLVTMFSIGSAKATFAGVAILLAHALFKATLFLVVGEIDIRTGTRDITELGGLFKTMPIATVTAVAAGLSMAGAPPLLGFMAKESAIEAVIKLSGTEQLIFSAAVIGGSVLTVAYTARFLICVFGAGPDTVVQPLRFAMTAPSALLAILSVAGYVIVSAPNSIVSDAAVELNSKASAYELIAWPGITTAFLISVGVLIVGGALGYALSQREVGAAPRPVGATFADNVIDGVLHVAPRLTARIQHGSLPVYITTMSAVAALATIPFVTELSLEHIVAWNRPFEPIIAVATIIAAVAGTFVGSRLEAALTLGAVGLGVSSLFVIGGAPDLALTQLLVETVVVVGFVLGLGQLREQFPSTDNTWQTIRISVALIGGFAVTAALAATTAHPAARAPVDSLTTAAKTEGGGKNVVNVILTDIRALDTLGEVVVLATVAIGILALARVRKTEPAQ